MRFYTAQTYRGGSCVKSSIVMTNMWVFLMFVNFNLTYSLAANFLALILMIRYQDPVRPRKELPYSICMYYSSKVVFSLFNLSLCCHPSNVAALEQSNNPWFPRRTFHDLTTCHCLRLRGGTRLRQNPLGRIPRDHLHVHQANVRLTSLGLIDEGASSWPSSTCISLWFHRPISRRCLTP